MRLDKYLKVSRLIKRRTVACDACNAGRVIVNGKPQKASYDLKIGDHIEISFGEKSVAVAVLPLMKTVKRAKHRSNNLNGGAIGMIGILLIIALVAAFIYKEEDSMRADERSYIEREASLNRQIEEEEQRTKTLTERKKYVATNQYIEEVAKSELGLVNSDEVLIKAKDE